MTSVNNMDDVGEKLIELEDYIIATDYRCYSLALVCAGLVEIVEYLDDRGECSELLLDLRELTDEIKALHVEDPDEDLTEDPLDE